METEREIQRQTERDSDRETGRATYRNRVVGNTTNVHQGFPQHFTATHACHLNYVVIKKKGLVLNICKVQIAKIL